MRSMTASVQTKVSGLDKIKQLFHFRRDLGTNVQSTVDVHANTSSVDDLDHKVHSIQDQLDRLHGNNHLSNSFTSATRSINGAGDATVGFGHHIERANHMTERARGGAHRLGGAFKAAFAGSVITQWAGSAYRGIKSVTEAGWKLNMAGKKAQITWRHIGLNNGQSNDMVKQMDQIRDSSDMDEQSISGLQKRFYTLTGSASQARSLTNEMIAFGKASGASSQDIGRLGMTLPRMLSASKVRGQMFNRTFSRTPALIGALAKASGKSRQSFLALVQSGKMTGTQLRQYLGKAAKYSGNAWDEYTKTAGGRIAYVRGLARETEEKATSGLTGSFIKGLDKISSKNKSLMQIRSSLGGIANTLGKKVGNFAGKAIAWIVKNQKPLLKTGTALMRIAGIAGKAVWKSFSSIFSAIFGHATKDTGGINGFANALTRLSKHTRGIRLLARTFAGLWAIGKVAKFVRFLGFVNKNLKIMTIIKSVANGFALFKSVLTGATTAQAAFDAALDANPIGAIVAGVTAAVAAITGLVVWLHHLYKTNRTVHNAFVALGHVMVGAFKVAIAPARWLNELLLAVYKRIWKVTAGIRKKIGGVAHGIGSWFHKGYSKANNAVDGFSRHVAGDNDKNTRSTRHYANASAHSIHGYLSKSGKYYTHYHKGLVKISSASYKMRERMRKRYSKRTHAELSKYEHNYRSYENKRNSLSRKYGKLRAMYSVKSLRLIEKRFRKLRSTILKITRGIYKDTRKWFKKIGKGTSSQFKGIYKAVRRWLGRSNKVMIKDYKVINKNSRHYLDGSIRRYVRELKYRFKRQRYYDGQLVKQTKRTNNIMNKLPLKWVYRETKMLNRNWRTQRKNFITHNKRMTKSLVTHIHTMSHHLRNFSKSFKDIFDDLESNIYDKWTKFWNKMHNAAGKGMNSVQSPLNEGAGHLNDFVRAFGETSSPLHRMPSVSYATGTGALSGISSIRRPITRLTSAILNDDNNNGQETVIHANGSVEKPQGPNVHEMLEPGAEVLNASETKLMDALSQPVHLATGTGFFSDLKGMLSGLGNFGGLSQSILFEQAKGKGDNKLLHELQKVLDHSKQIFSGFMGSDPQGFSGLFRDIVQGLFAQSTNTMSQWWSTLMNLTNQTLNDNGSDSPMLKYAEQFAKGKHYVYGATGGNNAYDCSGFVQAVLSHYGVNAPRTSGAQINSFPHISRSQAKAGDLVGNGGHIGIVADNGAKNYFSAFSPSEGIRMFPLTSTYWDGGPMTFARVPKLSKLNGSSGKLNFKGATKGLMSFVKRQEAPMFKWIEKHLAPLIDANPGGFGVARWRPYVEKALKANGFSADSSQVNAWMRVISRESNGNPHAVNHWDSNAKAGHPSEGLVQTIGPTFDAYAKPGHHNIFSGYDDLLAGIAYMASKYGRGSSAFARVSGPEGYYKGGHFNANQLMTVGERGPELIKPDFSGQVIPHDESKRVVNNSRKPVNVQQDIHINVKGDSKADDKHIVNVLQHYGDKLAHKLNGGGDLVV